MIDIDRLRALLETRALNPFSAAKAAGLGADYVRDILRGKVKEPSGYKLGRLANALDVSVEYLLGQSDELGRPPSAQADHHPQVSHLPIQHRLAARVFRPLEDEHEIGGGLAVLTFDLSEFSSRNQWLGVISDDHALPLIAKGHVVHVADFTSLPEPDLSMGDLAVMETYSPDRVLVERTVCQVAVAFPGRIAARPISSVSEDGSDMIYIDSKSLEDSDQTRRVVGKVLYSHRPFDGHWRLTNPTRPRGAWPE